MPSLENPQVGITSFAILLGYYYSSADVCNEPAPSWTLSWRVKATKKLPAARSPGAAAFSEGAW